MSIDEEDESLNNETENSLEGELAVPFISEMSPAEIERFVALRGSKLEGISSSLLHSLLNTLLFPHPCLTSPLLPFC